jgi:8-amino-7-oxononanoate synthase
MASLEQALEQRRREHLYREREVLATPAGPEVVVGGEKLLAFCSNDYLGLANHPQVVRALQEGAARYGAGAGASHLVSGHSAAHHALEEELADFAGAERALLFSTGYMANLGVVSALLSRHDTIFEDRLNHASLIDAARLARAKVIRFPHGDAGRLADLLGETDHPSPITHHAKLITTDAVFSMDGDTAPLAELTALAHRHHARLLVDDAHGFGVLGAQGRGSLEAQGVPLAPPAILMGTLGKALGTFGAFVAGEAALIETLIQQARTYIYTTALPPAVAEATRAALRLVRDEPWRREHLRALIARFRSGATTLGLKLMASDTAIQPIVLGDAEAALTASRALRTRGIWVPAIRPPTVPAGSARLRITLSAAHSFEQVDRLLAALAA